MNCQYSVSEASLHRWLIHDLLNSVGRSGDNCDVQKQTCADIICQNGGTCMTSGDVAMCNCPLGRDIQINTLLTYVLSNKVRTYWEVKVTRVYLLLYSIAFRTCSHSPLTGLWETPNTNKTSINIIVLKQLRALSWYFKLMEIGGVYSSHQTAKRLVSEIMCLKLLQVSILLDMVPIRLFSVISDDSGYTRHTQW